MENLEEARGNIYREVIADDADVRSKFLLHFDSEIKTFSEEMGRAFLTWRLLDNDLKGDINRANISALVFNVINLHIVSMKLFVSGYIIAGALALTRER